MREMFSVTYDVVTPESAEDGDNAETGFVLSGNWRVSIEAAMADVDGNYKMTLRDAVSLTGDYLADAGSWFEQMDGDTDYRTGAETRYALHPPRTITKSSYARLKRVLHAR